MTNTLLLATKNKGKIREIKNILSDIPYEVKTLEDIKMIDEVEEKGRNYRENAILKAQTIGEKTRMLTLGEDSGLEIDALNGWPGLHSARHTKGTDDDRIDKILEKLQGIPKEKRLARYKTVVALYDPRTKNIQLFDGVAEGYITERRIGSHGFGYDPIFWSKDLRKTFGLSSDAEKHAVSHRGRAVNKVKKYLSDHIIS